MAASHRSRFPQQLGTLHAPRHGFEEGFPFGEHVPPALDNDVGESRVVGLHDAPLEEGLRKAAVQGGEIPALPQSLKMTEQMIGQPALKL